MLRRPLSKLGGRRVRLLMVLTCFLGLYTWNQGYAGSSSTFQHDEYMLVVAPGLMYSSGSWIAKQTSSKPPTGRHDHYQTMLGPPHCFHYAFISVVHSVYLAGSIAGYYGTPFDLIKDYYFVQQIGRALIVLCSLGSLLMTYRTGRLLFGSEQVALAALILMGLSSYYFLFSRLAKVDVPMIFFATVSMYYAIRANESCNITDYLWAGVFCGMSAGTKLPGTFTLFPIVTAYVIGVARGRESLVPWKLVAAGLAAFCGVFGTNPNLLVYFDDFLWALQTFSQDLRSQSGITQPALHYYLSLDSLRLLVDRTFPEMFAGRVATYFALGGFAVIVAERRWKGLTLVSLPVCYILLNLPMLVTKLFREYHLCIFVMSLLAAYCIHVCVEWAVGRRFQARMPRILCWCVALALLLKTQAAYAERMVYYAGQPSNKILMLQWVDSYVPAGSRFLTSELAGADSRRYRTTNFWDVARSPSWRNEVTQNYDYASIVPYKAGQLFAFCEQNASLLRVFPSLGVGYADIRLYAMNDASLGRVGTGPTGSPLRGGGFVTEALPMDGLLRFKRRASGPLSAVVSFGGSLVYVALPEDYGAAYVRIPDEITLGDGVAKVGELPFEVHTSQRVVSVDRVYSDDRLVAEEFGLSDGITRRAYARPPEQLLDQAVWTSSIRSPVLHVPDYLQSILREVGVAPNEDASESLQGGQIVSVARPAGAARMQLEIEPGQDFRKMVRMRIDPAAGSPESYSPPRRVRIQVLRPDGTESRIVFQNWPLQDIRVLLPPVGLSPGDRVRLEFS